METLYLKTHNKTGKKYLGKTNKDPFVYLGSGKDWKEHLQENGTDISTEILFRTESKSQLKSKGNYYSKLWDIVNSPDFLNLKVESGDGGGTPWSDDRHAKFKEQTADDIWINNGKESTRGPYGYIPKGWKRGRLSGYKANRSDRSYYIVNYERYSYREGKAKFGPRFGKAVARMNKLGLDSYRPRETKGYEPLYVMREIENDY